MASPPRLSPATSPPYPQHAVLPNLNSSRKRPSIQTSHQYNTAKRRRPGSVAGSAASSAHPLRQTSFPPVENLGQALRSPSIESEINGAGDDGRSVKSRKKKGKRNRREVSESEAGLTRRTSERSVTGDLAEDEDDDDDDVDALIDDTEEADKAAERKNLSVLVDAFTADQAARYETFRRVKLRKETVRKIANFTLAQSVPAPVITTINGYTKTFIGTLVEGARDVQRQWAALETPPASPQSPKKEASQGTAMDVDVKDEGGKKKDAESEHAPKSKQEAHKAVLGPLLPDHFREALRRHRKNGEGNATGLTGVSVGLGAPGTGAARTSGRRLFR